MKMSPLFVPVTRRTVIGGAAAMVALPLLRPAQAQERSYDLNPQQVAPGVWMIEGRTEVFARSNGGDIVNIAMLETPEGAIVIDTGSSARMGAAIRAFADQKLGGVVATLNTHHHPDHWFGNGAFADRPIHALPQTITTCQANSQDYAESLYSILGTWMTGTQPVAADLALDAGPLVLGGRALQLLALSGHTSADLAVQDQDSGVLIAADLVFLDRAPSLPDADFTLWLTALAELEALSANGIIPGHGPFHHGNAGIDQTRAYLQGTRARLDLAAQLGLSPIEAMSAGPVPEFADLGANPEEYLRSVARRWADHEAIALPVIGGA